MAEIAACSLCELPCGRNPLLRTYDGRALPFCCMGCANLHTILLESGVLVSGLLSKVEDAFRLGARTTRVVRQNLSWAFFYNIVGITLALSGVLTPIFAAAAMLLSSTSVVANSMRLIRQEGR